MIITGADPVLEKYPSAADKVMIQNTRASTTSALHPMKAVRKYDAAERGT